MIRRFLLTSALGLGVLVCAVAVNFIVPRTAVALGCAGDPDGVADFAGIRKYVSPRSYGAQAFIEVINHSLCTGASTFSSDWVAVVRPTHPFNIFQIGIDKCRNAACPPGAPENAPYYFWAFGRMTTQACGQGVGPSANPINAAGTPTGAPRLRVEYTPSPAGYDASINGTVWVHVFDPATCWGGVPSASDIFSEVYDLNTQQGGSLSNKQGYTDARYKDTSYWRHLDNPLKAPCTINNRVTTTTKCNTSSSAMDDYFMGDTRWP
jgi:hypothetical protein